MLNIEYATDTYSVFNFNSEQVYAQFASSGRFITAIIGRLVKIAGFSEQAIYVGSYLLAIICVLISQYKVYGLLKDNVKNKNFRILIAILIIINPFSIELFLFIEKGVMWLGVLMAVCAVERIVKYFETNRKRNIVYAMIFMFLANCSYQGVVGIFVSVSLIYILKYSSDIKEFVKNNIVVAVTYGIPAVADYLLIKILYQGSRVNGQIILSESVSKIFDGTIQMIISTYGLLPKYLFIISIGILFSLGVYETIRKKRKAFYEISKYIYIIIGTIIITVMPQIMQSTSSIWFVPRSTYAFGALYGILIMLLYLNHETGNFTTIVIIIISIILSIFQFTKFSTIINDRYKLNEQDYIISMHIINKIMNYEMSTENKISKIEIYQDKNPRYTYDGIFATGDINVKAYSTDWSTKAIIEYYLKRELKQEVIKEDRKRNFLEMDWDEFNIDEQVILQDDTIIICRY